MSDFETMIRAMVKNGASFNDITKQASDIIKTINSENSKKTERENALGHYKTQFDKANAKVKACTDCNFTVADAAALCVLAVESNHPDWGPKELDEFYNSILNSIEVNALMVGKTPGQALSDGLKSIFKDFSDYLPNKSKEDKKDAGPVGKTSISITGKKKSPEDIMLEFIESL